MSDYDNQYKEWPKEIMDKIEESMRKMAEDPSVVLKCSLCERTQSLAPIVSGETKMTLQEQMCSTVCEYCGMAGCIEREI